MSKKIRIFLAGDSTMASYGCRQKPMAGWGQILQRYFNPEEVQVCNRAICGRSSRTFIEEGRLERIAGEMQPGDYLFTQFGHNDATISRPARYTPAGKAFQGCLRQFIAAAREKGAVPVLVSPVQRRCFDAAGNFVWDHAAYVADMKQLEKEEHVALLDLSTVSGHWFDVLGAEWTKQYFCHIDAGVEPNYPSGCADDTHFQYRGARLIASLVIGELEQSELPLRMQLIRHRHRRIFLAGDSTMADYGGNEEPMAGWGQFLQERFQSHVEICNFAYCGKSSKSFWEDGRLERILREIRPGDYLFIQFAHNDEKLGWQEPENMFQQYLQRYIDSARAHYAQPVLVTPIERRSFVDGRIQPTHEPYAAAMKELAKRENVPLLDMNQASRRWFEQLGPVGTKKVFLQTAPAELPNYLDGHIDNTHFSEIGARLLAGLAAELMGSSSLDIRRDLKDMTDDEWKI